jgi:hypothetical protein
MLSCAGPSPVAPERSATSCCSSWTMVGSPRELYLKPPSISR